jgi:N-acetylglucosaminyldiphosphoundecaprenol N-acetyl-beta-D-mannosaminyltransferase
MENTVKRVRVCKHEVVTCGVDEFLKIIENGYGGWVVTMNLEMISRGSKDPSYFELIDGADYIVADGMPIVWISKIKHKKNSIKERLNGADLVFRLLTEYTYPSVIIGGINPKAAVKNLGVENPSMVKIFDGKIDEDWVKMHLEDFKNFNPKIIYIALGVPKQDYIANLLRVHLPNAFILGIGGTFDFFSGDVKRAPKTFRDTGLEWLFRLMVEPKRLWKRYIISYPRGVLEAMKDIFGLYE